MALKVYATENSIVFNQSFNPINSLKFSVSGDNILFTSPAIVSVNYADIVDINGAPAGANVADVVTYLNAQTIYDVNAIIDVVASGLASESTLDDVKTELQGIATQITTTNNTLDSIELGNDFKLSVAMGVVPKHQLISVQGYNPDIDVAASETIWTAGGTWTPLTTARKMSIVSASANDTALGTGARMLYILGVDANRNLQTETITLNGVTPVVTTNSWLGINQCYVATAGSTMWNVGDITLTAQTDLTTQCVIKATESIAYQAIYHIPTGYKGYLVRRYTVCDKIILGNQPFVSVDFRIVTNGVNYLGNNDKFSADQRAEMDSNPNRYYLLPGGSYFYCTATTDTDNTWIRSNIEFYLVQD